MTCDNTQVSIFGNCIPTTTAAVAIGGVSIASFYLLGQTEKGRQICHDLRLLDCIQPVILYSLLAGLGAYYFSANRFKNKLCTDPNFVTRMTAFKSSNTTSEFDLMKYYLL